MSQLHRVHVTGPAHVEHRDHAIGDEGIARTNRSFAFHELCRRAVVSAQALGFVGIGRQKHVAAAIELEGLPALAVERIEQVDAAIHEAHHRVIRPRPIVAIGFGALAACQRQRLARIDEQHAVTPWRTASWCAAEIPAMPAPAITISETR